MTREVWLFLASEPWKPSEAKRLTLHPQPGPPTPNTAGSLDSNLLSETQKAGQPTAIHTLPGRGSFLRPQ